MRILRLGVPGVPNNACEIWYMESFADPKTHQNLLNQDLVGRFNKPHLVITRKFRFYY